MGHNPRVPTPRYQAYPAPSSRRARRRTGARLVLAGAALAIAAIVVLPALQPAADLTTRKGPPANAAAAQAPSLAAGAGSGSSPAAPSAEPAPTATPAPANRGPIGSTLQPAVIGTGRPPSRLAAELTGTTAPDPSILAGYRWPLAHPRLTLPFGPTVWGSRIVGGERFHDGIDIATFCGDLVRAAHAGKVIAAGRHVDDVMGWVGDLGPYYRRLDRLHAWSTLPIIVVIDDRNGYRSMYAHFGRIVVKPGQVVKAGQLLGYEGMTGHASGCHVHYGLYSPWEQRTFAIRPDVVKRMKVPKAEIARIDPRLVLPPLPKGHAKPTAQPPTSP